jgi:GNAT superfamily N-acetyltransferase
VIADFAGSDRPMDVQFTTLSEARPGDLASLLERAYAPLRESDRRLWSEQRIQWHRFDASAFKQPDTIGACTFLTRFAGRIVGFASYDPRPAPDVGIVAHNCVVPEFQRKGIGAAQMREVLRRLRAMNIRRARVLTLDLPFFAPARSMYVSAGFSEITRGPYPSRPRMTLIEYECPLDGSGDSHAS